MKFWEEVSARRGLEGRIAAEQRAVAEHAARAQDLEYSLAKEEARVVDEVARARADRAGDNQRLAEAAAKSSR